MTKLEADNSLRDNQAASGELHFFPAHRDFNQAGSPYGVPLFNGGGASIGQDVVGYQMAGQWTGGAAGGRIFGDSNGWVKETCMGR